jgi:hypothetical protein
LTDTKWFISLLLQLIFERERSLMGWGVLFVYSTYKLLIQLTAFYETLYKGLPDATHFETPPSSLLTYEVT